MSVAKRVLGPRPWLLLAIAALKVVVIVVFTYVILDSQANSRREAEKRFDAAAKISAALTSSLFSASQATSATTAAKQFGGPTVSQAALDAAVTQAHQPYELILDGHGTVLAASKATPAADRTAGYA